MANVERALIAYAVLKNQLEKADLYEGLLVFFRPVTASFAGKRFIPGELAKELGDTYGLHVPALVLESLAERMATSGLLIKHSESNGAATYIYAASDILATNVSLPKITQLLLEFKVFSRDQSTELRNLDDSTLENALFDRLLRIESLGILSRRDGIEPLKKTAQTLILKKKSEISTDISTLEIHLDYVVPRFILSLLETDKEGFELLSDIASANLAAETLLTYRDPPRKGDVFDELDIYLDSPLCLDILGVNLGKEEYGAQLSQELKNAGCRVNVFLHSINEIERVLDARKQSYLHGTNTFGRFHVDSPQIQGLVNVLAGHSEQVLTEQHGFNIIDSANAIPSGRRSTVGADEEKAIRDQLGGWKNEEGRELDISTCCDLIRMRSGLEIQTRILKAGVILATRNTILAKSANTTWRNWLSDKSKGSKDRIKSAAPLAITDKQLAGLLWITQGGQVGSLGRTHLIANCAAAITTRKDVIARVYNTLVETSEQSAKVFAALINDQRAERALMDSTFGDPDVITDESVLPLLEKIRLSTAHEVEISKNLEIEKLSIEIKENIADSTNKIAQLALERDNSEGRLKAAEIQTKLLEDRERDRQEALIIKAFGRGKLADKITVFLLALILGFLSYLLQWKLSIKFEPYALKFPIFVIPGLVFAISSFILTWDIPEFFVGALRDRISMLTFKYFATSYGVDSLIDQYILNFRTKSIEKLNLVKTGI